jgi:hypothetical protein
VSPMNSNPPAGSQSAIDPAVCPGTWITSKERRDHTVGGLVAIPTDLLLETRPEVRSQQREPVGIADPVRIGLVAPPLVERVQPADVVEVVMGGDGHDRPVVSECLELRAEIADPVARIDDEIALAAAHVPHVRLEERVDVILHEQHDLHR